MDVFGYWPSRHTRASIERAQPAGICSISLPCKRAFYVEHAPFASIDKLHNLSLNWYGTRIDSSSAHVLLPAYLPACLVQVR